MDHGIWVLPLVVRNSDAFPRREVLKLFYEPTTAAAQGDELHSLVVEFGEMRIGGELRVEDQGGVQSSPYFLPEGQESKDLFIGLISA